MMAMECRWESEIAEAIEDGRWPAACHAELVSHAASCAVCRDVAGVASAIREDGLVGRSIAHIPSPGLVWWRAQLKARHDVAETAGRPITVVQTAAGIVAACVLFMLGGLLWPWLRESVAWIDQVSRAVDVGRLWFPIALAAGAWIVIAPLVLLVVLSDD